jgi:hypothetical protein
MPATRTSADKQVKRARPLFSSACRCIVNSRSAQQSAGGDFVPVGQELTGSGCPKFPLISLDEQGSAGYAVGGTA